MDTQNIVAVYLLIENPQKNIGVNRIERIELEYESGEKEHVSEYDFTFEYNEDDDSFSRVADEIAKIFGVRPEIIQTEFWRKIPLTRLPNKNYKILLEKNYGSTTEKVHYYISNSW